jgi:hypothetical protein
MAQAMLRRIMEPIRKNSRVHIWGGGISFIRQDESNNRLGKYEGTHASLQLLGAVAPTTVPQAVTLVSCIREVTGSNLRDNIRPAEYNILGYNAV